jgi:Ca2+-binding RTX toxin-like protein
VRADVSGYTLAGNAEVLILAVTTAVVGTGNALVNTLIGNGADNTLDGGVGADSLAGGAGNDYYIVDSLTDVVSEAASAGIDSVIANISGYTLGSGSEVEVLVLNGTSVVSGYGNTFANSLIGNAAANTLNGGLGTDTLDGGAGNDYYIVETTSDVIVDSAGTDSVLANVVGSYSLAATNALNAEVLILGATTATTGYGNSSANTLIGNAAANTLDGGIGADSLAGGAGNDYYIVDSTADSVYEVAGEGTADSVRADVSGYTLAGNAEVLILAVTTAVVGTGNALANTLIGNGADNTLNGGAGADSLVGGAGNDYYIVDSLTDAVFESATQGTDSVIANISAYTLGSGSEVEVLVLNGTSVLSGYGNTIANTLIGNAAANTLDGGVGVDSLFGGTGNDYYIIDTTADVVSEAAGVDIDSVLANVGGYTLAGNAEVLVLGVTTATTGYGNSTANTLIGNAAANTLDGGVGSDSLAGGAGNDYYIVDSVNDVVSEVASAGIDSVEANVSGYVLGANVEILIVQSGVNGFGNSLANTLIGANSQDILLVGGAGSDSIFGGSGNDQLLGASDGLANGGIGEIDTLTGGSGADVFVLGTDTGVLYNDGIASNAGIADYALITDYNVSQDFLQLKGAASNYYASTTMVGGLSGLGVYLETGSTDELIAVIQNGSANTANTIGRAIYTI